MNIMQIIKRLWMNSAVTIFVVSTTLLTTGVKADKPTTGVKLDKPVASIEVIQVNAQKISRLPSGGKLIIDLTRRGVIYDFDSSTHPIDFTSVVVRTTAETMLLESWLKKTFPSEQLAGLKSGHLRIATRAKDFLTLKEFTKPPTGTLPFTCYPTYCSCSGYDDCIDMFGTNECGSEAICEEIGGDLGCICSRPSS